MMVVASKGTIMAVFFGLLSLTRSAAFVSLSNKVSRPLHLSEEINDQGDPIIKSTVRIDDGSSDLTDRFKYKVNALMGVFDPTGTDDERQDGNILNAMLKFPSLFTFNVVGRTNGDEVIKEKYVEQVKEKVLSISGYEDDFQCQVTPRGKSFTRISIQVKVDSAAVINSIYEELDKMEMTIMKY
mmetsp:Transcript_10291/g.15108  ORF Transcript_10291/g.15108 Transcript_10291/m.15108 type:complete len:184 (+) Transcript_10291:826-1377(+)